VLGYKTKQKHSSSYGLHQLKNSLPSLNHAGKPPDTESRRAPRKMAPAKRSIPREDSLEIQDVFLDRDEKKLQANESNRSMSTEGTEPDSSWNGSAGSFSSSSLPSDGGRWIDSNEGVEDALASPTDESVHSKTSSRSSDSSNSDATTCASNLSAIARARRRVISQSSTAVEENSKIRSKATISSTEEIDELDLMEYTGSGSSTASRIKSTLGSTLAMLTKTNEAAARLAKDINAFESTVQAAGCNKKLDGAIRCLSDTDLVSQYQMKQQEIEQLQRFAADRKGEAVRYKQMADQLHASSSSPGTRSPMPAKTSRRGSTGAIEWGKNEVGKRRSQLTRSGRGTKDLPSIVTSQTTGGILKQKRRYSTSASSDTFSNMGTDESFHENADSFLSQDSVSARSTSIFSVKFKKPTIITYEKELQEQDRRTSTPYDSDGRRRRPSRHCAAGGVDLNDVIVNEVVTRRLATAGRRTACRRNSMPAGHMGESSSTMLPSTKPATRRSTTDMITSMERRLRRLSNESSDDSSSQYRPIPAEATAAATTTARLHSDQPSPLDYSSNISRRLSGDAVSSFYHCPEDNALDDVNIHGVGERGAATTFSSAEESRSRPRSSPRSSPRVVTRPQSKMEMLAMKAFGIGGRGK